MTKWAILKKEDIETLGLSTYNGEVILVDYESKVVDKGSFYFNAQEFFSKEDLDKMPVFSTGLFSDASKGATDVQY